jgi:hypothetical protein
MALFLSRHARDDTRRRDAIAHYGALTGIDTRGAKLARLIDP